MSKHPAPLEETCPDCGGTGSIYGGGANQPHARHLYGDCATCSGRGTIETRPELDEDEPEEEGIGPPEGRDPDRPNNALWRYCSDCGVNLADYPARLCPGCLAYREHTGQI